MALQISTSIHIQASPAQVWDILTDFEKYSEWNPFILSLTGKPTVGSKIKVVFAEMKFQPIVLEFEKNKSFKWIGHLLFKGLFDGAHHFVLSEQPDGSTLLVQKEDFQGMLVPLFKRKLMTDTVRNFNSMNEALKKRAEAKK